MMMAMTTRVMATPITTMTTMPIVVIMIAKIMGMATTIEGIYPVQYTIWDDER
jgi:hypothetical protein